MQSLQFFMISAASARPFPFRFDFRFQQRVRPALLQSSPDVQNLFFVCMLPCLLLEATGDTAHVLLLLWSALTRFVVSGA